MGDSGEIDWKLTQVLGGEGAGKTEDEDTITSMAFDEDGQHLAVGDKAGRIVIFEKAEFRYSKVTKNQYQFLTEYQSHVREFDYLK